MFEQRRMLILEDNINTGVQLSYNEMDALKIRSSIKTEVLNKNLKNK